ncbi:MAG: phenazine biosynthesis protein PhzF family [Bacteroidetes bacterium]|nr:MAG: phenazine biosynthesis protein PhzF family [Bacteroidota bacterium]
MKTKIYQVDAFAEQVFSGNPAAVCPLGSWLPDEMMQHIAAENNLAETAFFVPLGDDFHIRWFTPAVEVDLCGHATLAAAHVLFEHEQYARKQIRFQSRSGWLEVSKTAGGLTLDFPADELQQLTPDPAMNKAIGAVPLEIWKGKTDYMLVFENQEQVEKLLPDFRLLAKSGGRGIIVTAPGRDCDFVSRFFAPQAGIDEDPVTGSAHTSLTPYWAVRLKKNPLRAMQVSRRGGKLLCSMNAGRVLIEGKAITYLKGTITT